MASFITWSPPPPGLSDTELQKLRELAFGLLASQFRKELLSIKRAISGTISALAVNFAMAALFQKVQEDNSLCFKDKEFLVEELSALANAADAGTLTADVIDGYIGRLDAMVAEVCDKKAE